MRKMILFALAMICAARCAGAAADPALYRVTGEGGGVCYIFGTIHVGTEKDAEALEKVFSALDECDVLLTEVDLSRLSGTDPEYILQAARYFLPLGDSMSGHLGEETVKEIAQSTGVSKLLLDRYAPAWAASYLEMVSAADAGLDAAFGTDQLLFSHAKEKGIVNEGMEDISVQMDAALSFTDGYVLDLVRAWLGDPEAMRREIEGLHILWIHGDEEGLTAYVDTMAQDDGEGARETYRVLYAERNVTFARRCAAEIGAGRTVMAAFSCGHLYGEDGVLRLLGDMGFTVERAD